MLYVLFEADIGLEVVSISVSRPKPDPPLEEVDEPPVKPDESLANGTHENSFAIETFTN